MTLRAVVVDKAVSDSGQWWRLVRRGWDWGIERQAEPSLRNYRPKALSKWKRVEQPAALTDQEAQAHWVEFCARRQLSRKR